MLENTDNTSNNQVYKRTLISISVFIGLLFGTTLLTNYIIKRNYEDTNKLKFQSYFNLYTYYILPAVIQKTSLKIVDDLLNYFNPGNLQIENINYIVNEFGDLLFPFVSNVLYLLLQTQFNTAFDNAILDKKNINLFNKIFRELEINENAIGLTMSINKDYFNYKQSSINDKISLTADIGNDTILSFIPTLLSLIDVYKISNKLCEIYPHLLSDLIRNIDCVDKSSCKLLSILNFYLNKSEAVNIISDKLAKETVNALIKLFEKLDKFDEPSSSNIDNLEPVNINNLEPVNIDNLKPVNIDRSFEDNKKNKDKLLNELKEFAKLKLF